jgi:pSer/pThr/pTyr-binding forkhead associated (FHA) protein
VKDVYHLRNPVKRVAFMPKLVVHSGSPQAREYELKAGANSVGRDDDNDFTIDDPSVSSFHAQIIMDGSSVSIKDLGSTNGTFVLHSQVKEGVIQPGQFIRLGNVFLVFKADSPASRLAPGDAPAVIPTAAAPNAWQQARTAGSTSVPSGSGLKITGLNKTTAAAPPPISVTPPPPLVPTAAPPARAMTTEQELAEPPSGKTACKFHPKTAGEWLCRKCNELFCTVCVTTKRTSEGTGIFCRKCGSACVPVKVKLVAPKEKPRKKYSDGVILFRSLAFGFMGALLSALVWTGLSWVFGVDVPFIFCVLAAVICGYAVKLGSLDTPGALFSTIAVIFCVIGSGLGKVGMLAVTHLTIFTYTSALTSVLGLVLGIYLAWKIGGGDT